MERMTKRMSVCLSVCLADVTDDDDVRSRRRMTHVIKRHVYCSDSGADRIKATVSVVCLCLSLCPVLSHSVSISLLPPLPLLALTIRYVSIPRYNHYRRHLIITAISTTTAWSALSLDHTLSHSVNTCIGDHLLCR